MKQALGTIIQLTNLGSLCKILNPFLNSLYRYDNSCVLESESKIYIMESEIKIYIMESESNIYIWGEITCTIIY